MAYPNSSCKLQLSDSCNDYCDEISEKLKSEGFRQIKDKKETKKLNYKIREISNEKIPYLIVVGEKEVKKKKHYL